MNLIVFWKKILALPMFYQCTTLLSKFLLRRILHLHYRKWTHNNNSDILCFVVTVTNKFVDVMLNNSLKLDRMTFSIVGKMWTEFFSEPYWFLKKISHSSMDLLPMRNSFFETFSNMRDFAFPLSQLNWQQ